MAAALTIDVMNPTTLAFVVPGLGAEYGLRSPIDPDGHPAAALLPLAGIAGTVIGSLSWGWLGDRIGRRVDPAGGRLVRGDGDLRIDALLSAQPRHVLREGLGVGRHAADRLHAHRRDDPDPSPRLADGAHRR